MKSKRRLFLRLGLWSDVVFTRFGNAEHGMAVLALDQLSPNFVRYGKDFSATQIRTDELDRHKTLHLDYRPADALT